MSNRESRSARSVAPTSTDVSSNTGHPATKQNSLISRGDLLKATAAAGAGLAIAGSGLSIAEATPTRQRARAGKVEVELWWFESPADPDYKLHTGVLRDFNASQSRIHATHQDFAASTLHDKSLTAALAGNPPDIAWALSEWTTEFHGLGLLKDLTSWVNAWPDRQVLYPQTWSGATYDGRIFGVPLYLDIRAFLYHAQMLRKAGVSRPPRTWKELQQVGVKVQKAIGPHAFALGMCGQTSRSPQEIIVYFRQSGTDIVKAFPHGKFRNVWKERPAEMAGAVETLQFYYDNMYTYQITPLEARSWDYTKEDTNFAAGRTAMNVDGSWLSFYESLYPHQMPDVAIAPIPYNRVPNTYLTTVQLVIFKNAKHPEAAFELAKYVAGKKAQQIAFPTLSVRRDVVGSGKWGKPFLDLIPYGSDYPQLNIARIEQIMIDAVQSVLYKRGSPKDVAASMADDINTAVRADGVLAT